ncbi:hypothetical protein C2E23DRAFT_831974 [Lenzites betulinus]|nr:hypothetical protein C2E23DRAFT_831974 [Lenzites betulinus]
MRGQPSTVPSTARKSISVPDGLNFSRRCKYSCIRPLRTADLCTLRYLRASCCHLSTYC